MKKILIVIVVLLVLLFTGCEKQNYAETDNYLEGLRVFTHVTTSEDCDLGYSEVVFDTEEYQYNKYNVCPLEFVVQVDGEYINVYDYIEEYNISYEEVISSGVVYKYSETPLFEEVGIDIKNISIVEVTVLVVDGEILTTGLSHDWERVTLELDFDLIKNDILRILTRDTDERHISFEPRIMTYGPSPEIKVTLTDGYTTFRCSLDEDRAVYIDWVSSTNETKYFTADLFKGYESELNNLHNIINQLYQEQKGDDGL